ncbi:hypothetical protein [Achromobacter aloeverae]|uniref:Uncharacterized protein n=1 Tax=Achromobacter aloeverae TaxID=1750518 RepID=A0A4Q1HF07_9BURK|nr:hypothetical protein [Achromobacter aloeverae]RXN85172.1 hypothetical protein C7R54_21975 [Achromobacter aloeverae]
MTDRELHALTEKLARAEALLGKQDSVALRAVRVLGEQVLGARASLGRPLLVASASQRVGRYAHAGAASTFRLGADFALPGLPLSASVSPRVGATYSSGVEVGEDLWISESRTVEARLGIIGRIKAFFLRLDLALTGRHARSHGRSYYDPDHLLQAPGSSTYRAERDVGALRDLSRDLSRDPGNNRAWGPGRTARWRSWLGMPKAFSLHSLDRVRLAAYARHDEFAKTAAMLGIVVAPPQAEDARHPLAESHRTAMGAGSPSSVVTTGLRLSGGAMLGGADEAGAPRMLRVHGQLEGGGSKSSTAIRTYVPVWDALDGQEAEQAGEAAIQVRLASLRAACAPMVRALQAYHRGPAASAASVGPAAAEAAPAPGLTPIPTPAPTPAPTPPPAPATATSRLGNVARVLDALSTWKPGDPPVPGADMNHALQALVAEHDLYCQAARHGPADKHARGLARSMERAWGVERSHGAYGYMRALAVTTALAAHHARSTGQPPPAACEALSARLAAPAMQYDSPLMKRATGFRNILPIETWQVEMALGADAGISLPLLAVAADVSGRIRSSRVTHFNALKEGDFIDVEVAVGLSGQLDLAAVFKPLMAWMGDHLGHAMSALAEAGVPAVMMEKLNGALKAISPSLGAGAHLVLAIRYSRPLADTAGDEGNQASSDQPRQAAGFNMEYVRVLARIDGAQNTDTVPLATVMGSNAIRSVLMRLDNCYRKDGDADKAERESRAYLSSKSVRRDLPGIFESLGQDDSAAARQVRAFVREATPHAVDAESLRALRSCEADFFAAMKAYTVAAAAAAAVEGGIAAAAAATAMASADPGTVSVDGALPVLPAFPALPEYMAAERALVALCEALRGPARVYQGKRTAYATDLDRLRGSA